MSKPKAVKFVESQKSLRLYESIREAFVDVLSKLTDRQLETATSNLIIMAFHDGMNGQVMHFEPKEDNFAVMQLYIPKNMPSDVLRWVVAHELGHVLQGRNWEESDGMSLEDDATEFAKKIGYPKTEAVSEWLAAKPS
ncbi:MAG: hypothetical protein U5L95_05000 [Candidatus Saccharibacteria bacterium]|nr:hypothetical protein [Candidatus Saccharibacteria bacterium]